MLHAVKVVKQNVIIDAGLELRKESSQMIVVGFPKLCNALKNLTNARTEQ